MTGRVLSIRYEEAPDESWSRVEVEIRDTWKGNAEADRIVVRAAAGALANPNFALEGAARFQTGENVLLFLTRSDDQYRPWAMVFGKYPIQGDGSEARLAGNLPFVAMDLDETGVVWLDDLRHEVDVIVARHTEEHLLDLALNP